MMWLAPKSAWARCAFVIVGFFFVALVIYAALAQPFGMTRAASPPEIGGFTGWILTKQAEFYRMFSGLIRQSKSDGRAAYTLLGISFLYGILKPIGIPNLFHLKNPPLPPVAKGVEVGIYLFRSAPPVLSV